MSNKKRKHEVVNNNFYELSEKDFTPPNDDRVIKSGIDEIYQDEYLDFINDFNKYVEDY